MSPWLHFVWPSFVLGGLLLIAIAAMACVERRRTAEPAAQENRFAAIVCTAIVALLVVAGIFA